VARAHRPRQEMSRERRRGKRTRQETTEARSNRGGRPPSTDSATMARSDRPPSVCHDEVTLPARQGANGAVLLLSRGRPNPREVWAFMFCRAGLGGDGRGGVAAHFACFLGCSPSCPRLDPCALGRASVGFARLARAGAWQARCAAIVAFFAFCSLLVVRALACVHASAAQRRCRSPVNAGAPTPTSHRCRTTVAPRSHGSACEPHAWATARRHGRASRRRDVTVQHRARATASGASSCRRRRPRDGGFGAVVSSDVGR
jgi:hypothetical protein